MPPAPKQSTLNTVLLVLSLLGGSITVVKFVAPLHTMPTELRTVQTEVRDMAHVQAVQTEALKTLAEVATDSKQLRRDVDRHEAELEGVQHRLENLEARP